MDETAEKLLEALRRLEQAQWRIGNKIAAIKAALVVAGVTVPASALDHENEYEYVRNRAFAGKRLIDCCERIVKDYQGQWVEKNRVVYLLERGGYTSEARDLRNSADCTLRRLAALGRIEVQKHLGAHGNKYRSMPQAAEKGPTDEPEW